MLLKTFFFAIGVVYSDNRSEFINDRVVELLKTYALRSPNPGPDKPITTIGQKARTMVAKDSGYIWILQRYTQWSMTAMRPLWLLFKTTSTGLVPSLTCLLTARGRERKRYPFHVHPLAARADHPSLLKRHVDRSAGGIHIPHSACRVVIEGVVPRSRAGAHSSSFCPTKPLV